MSAAGDLRQGFRLAWRQPGFVLLGALALALGIGANCAVFSAVHAVLLAPLPFAAPERLVVMWERQPALDAALVEISYPAFREWQRQSRSFAGLGALSASPIRVALTGRERPENLVAGLVSGELLAVVGVEPAEGRLLAPEDDRVGAERAAVLSDRQRRRLFGPPRQDNPAVGRRLTLSGQAYTVVGVLPPGFDFPAGADLWLPVAAVAPEVTTDPRTGFLRVVGRLRPGIGADRARQEMAGVVRRTWAGLGLGGAAAPAAEIVLLPLADQLLGETREGLLILFGVVALVLLIACADVANLLLARANGRGAELTVRAAVGAGRGRLTRQLLAESVPLGLLGGLGGLALAGLAIHLLGAFGPPEVPRLTAARLSAPVLLFALACTLLSVALSAALPAFRTARRVDFRAGLGEGGGGMQGRASRRFTSLLLAAQAAMAVVLLAAAGLLLSRLLDLQRIDLGFNPGGVLTAEVQLDGEKYTDPARRQLFHDALLQRLRALPGVESAAVVLLRPLEGEVGWDLDVTAFGQTAEQHRANPRVNFETVSRDYFRTLGIPIVAGRDIGDADRADAAPVAVVGEGLAHRLWPGQPALGQRLKTGAPEGPLPWRTVVGVVRDARYRGLSKPTLDLYVPAAQSPLTPSYVVLRTAGNPLGLAAALEREVWALDRDQPVSGIATLEQRVASQLAGPRLLALLTVLFALLATVLSALGIYGVISYAASRRAREIGLRLALGARRGEILRLVAREGLLPAGVGAALGALAAFWLSRLLAHWLTGPAISSRVDPLVLAVVALLLLAAAVLAVYLPARRALRIAPSLALREE